MYNISLLPQNTSNPRSTQKVNKLLNQYMKSLQGKVCSVNTSDSLNSQPFSIPYYLLSFSSFNQNYTKNNDGSLKHNDSILVFGVSSYSMLSSKDYTTTPPLLSFNYLQHTLITTAVKNGITATISPTPPPTPQKKLINYLFCSSDYLVVAVHKTGQIIYFRAYASELSPLS